MKSILLTSILVALGAVQCGTEPVACGCSSLIISSANSTRIGGATVRWISPALAGNETIVAAVAPGQWDIGGPGCLPGAFELEVSHPDYVTQRVRVEDSGYRTMHPACAQRRSDTVNVTLQPMPR